MYMYCKIICYFSLHVSINFSELKWQKNLLFFTSEFIMLRAFFSLWMIVSGGTDDSNNIESSMNTDFIPELDLEDFVLQQHDLGSPDVVSLSEGLSTSDGPTSPLL